MTNASIDFVVTFLSLVALFAGIFGVPALVEAHKLRHPHIGAVPLPSVDDPRWVSTHYGAELGQFSIRYHSVSLFGEEIGNWPSYAWAVKAHLLRAQNERLALAALDELGKAD